MRFYRCDGSWNEVHGRRTDKAGNKAVRRPIVEIERAADLLNRAFVKHNDFVSHGHGFDLIVGHIDRCGAQTLVQLFDFAAHLHPQFGVEIRKRLVE